MCFRACELAVVYCFARPRSLVRCGSMATGPIPLAFCGSPTKRPTTSGRRDPKTGKMALVKVPTAHAVPYGIVILPNNTLIFCEFGTNKLGQY
jgi:hypothetical protein